MRIRSQTKNSLTAARVGSSNKVTPLMPNDDQHFLLSFIMGTYFGPDLKREKPQKSALQRKSDCLPPYTSDQLAGSHIKTVEVERVYYYVLRKAHQSFVVKGPIIDKFLKGNLSIPPGRTAAVYPQFPDLFPLEMHPHSKLGNRYKIIKNISFINNPEVSYIKPEDITRFKRLTGLEDLLLDRDAARLHVSRNGGDPYNVALQDAETNGELPPIRSPCGSKRRRKVNDMLQSKDQCTQDLEPSNCMPFSSAPVTSEAPTKAKHELDASEKDSPVMIFLQSHPTREDLANMVAATKTGFALTGSAAMGHVGPIIGQMDIGECEDSYLFRVSLPGVKRDESEFSCEVDNDGKVLIRGVTTTGEKRVYRYSQVFEMQSQNLSPPGHFSISFQLPGPVDPQQFSGNFGTDGILEGIVMKRPTN
ncbi:hypothetical protein SLA2020_504910 [Shorea laevis]